MNTPPETQAMRAFVVKKYRKHMHLNPDQKPIMAYSAMEIAKILMASGSTAFDSFSITAEGPLSVITSFRRGKSGQWLPLGTPDDDEGPQGGNFA